MLSGSGISNGRKKMSVLIRIQMLFTLTCLLLVPMRADAAETSLIAFKMEAHDGVAYTEASWANRPLVLFISTRAGSAHNEERVWSRPLAGFFAGRSADAMLVGVADAAGLPRIVRGMARKMAAPTDDDPLRIRLMDWEGVFMQRYSLAADAYNVLVFNRSGQLVYTAALRAFNQSQLDNMLRELQLIVAAF
jgi:hypothetical protein